MPILRSERDPVRNINPGENVRLLCKMRQVQGGDQTPLFCFEQMQQAGGRCENVYNEKVEQEV